MNHQAKVQLVSYMFLNLDTLTSPQLEEYLWLIEQALQELRDIIVSRRPPWELDDPNA